MIVWRTTASASTVPMFLMLVSAAPARQTIAHPEYKQHTLTIPAGSPVRFRNWDKYGVAHFDGRFTLTGTFTYGCAFDCGEPPDEAYYQLEIVPDAAIAARLPRWNNQGDVSIVILREKRLVASIATRQRTALRVGKIPYLTGRTTIVVDDVQTGFSCDAAYFTARFVAIAAAPQLARTEQGGVGTCV